jgi:hypothetical protein
VGKRAEGLAMDKQTEMTNELRKARNWILAVGLIMFSVDMMLVYLLHGDLYTAEGKRLVLLIDLGVLGYFVGMYVLAKFKPVAGCVLALVGFWAIVLFNAVNDPKTLASGIILKILFTMALIKGIKSASRAEQLKRELGEVFG